MWTACAGHAQGEEPAQGRMRDDIRPVVEEARIEPRLPYDRIGIETELAQGRRDLLGDPEVDVAGGKRPPDPVRTVDGTDTGVSWPMLVRLDSGPMSLVIVMALSSSFES